MSSSTSTDPEQLHQLLDAQYHLVREVFQFGSHELELWRPADPESIMDDATLEKTYREMEWQPYWAQAWEASIGLCEFFAGHDLTGLRVLDLGCGLGWTTSMLLAAGANVIAGDNAPPALQFTRLNTWEWKERCSVQHLDWNHSTVEPACDLIVGSDILYDRQDIPALDAFFRKNLASRGRVVLGDPSRAMTTDFLDEFPPRGWKQEITSVNHTRTRHPTRIVEMSR